MKIPLAPQKTGRLALAIGNSTNRPLISHSNPVNPVSKWNPRAFTLLELLVAMALLSLLVVMLMGLVDGATKLWRTNENRVESYREARAALNLIASDLGSLYASPNPSFFRFEATPTGSEDDGSMAFLTALALDAQDSEDKSDLCSVGFFLASGPVSDIGPDSRRTTWNLYRYFQGSNATFDALVENPSSPNFWPEEFTPADGEILARNIRNFQVRGFVQNGNSWEEWSQSEDTPLPEVIEIEIEAVNTDFARRLNGDIKQEPADIEAQTRRWVTRIPVRQPIPTP